VIRLAVRVARADAEIVLAALLDLAPSGVEEVEIDADVVEYAVYGASGELPELPDLRAAAGSALVEVRTTQVADDWDQRWKAFHRPVLVGDPELGPALRVRPPWAQAWAGSGSGGSGGSVHELVIDPGQAFGTGAHATTRLCLELMLDLARAGRARGALCDVGCGSGVLSIAAARLGFEPVLAVDNDPLAVDATRENAVVNGVSIEVSRCDLRREPPPAAPTIFANLLAPLLLELAGTLAQAAPEVLVAGGLLVGEVDDVAIALTRALGLNEVRRAAEGDWAAVMLAGAAAGS
jgi:ribosomal protein L11 methyltransferase